MSDLLKHKLSELEQLGIDSAICSKIEDHVQNSIPEHTQRISPYRLADKWSLDREDVLNAFLYGTKSGIFDLEWDLKCPSCTGPTSTANTLTKLLTKSHCEYCRIDITGSFDEAVEVTFKVNQNIRDTGELALRHVMKSWLRFEEPITLSVEAQSQQELRMELKPGSYHMFNAERGLSCPLKITEDVDDQEPQIKYQFDATTISRGNEWYGTGLVNIKLENKSDYEADFTFARLTSFPWVSGAQVASNQIFRDYFSSELISSDESFSIKNLVLVFTDIKGSTDLYERRGDSKAYYLVREHFKIMTKIVKKNRGAIVKTIGDAIMATFTVSSDAIQAVFEMHEAFDEFNKNEKSRDDIVIKIGVHRGACIAVTSNDKLDYFGRTVNIAARIQGLSGGNDVMISKKLYDETGVEEQVLRTGWNTKPIQATLKGVHGLYDVIHVTL